MFDVLVYLYETYYRPDACPEPEVLARKLSAAGFEQDDISQALGWLTDLADSTNEFGGRPPQLAFSDGIRIYAASEMDRLGTAVVGFIQFLESAKMLDPMQREIVIERALAAGESQLTLDKLKVIVLMVLWSEGKEPDGLMFDELFLDDEDDEPRLLH
ncbi:MAG: DUF494 domain-containing protein [Burkholderiaceae bacterium]